MTLKPVHNHDCSVVINGDPSISRVHAKLLVQTDGTVFITDLSKYGSSVNSKQLPKDQRHRLKEGDVIKFGNQPNKSEFRLHRKQLVVCFSNMSASQKTAAKTSASKLGAKVVDVWDNSCTHLIMNGIMVTVKVVNALSNLKPIVTPKWLEDCVTAIRGGNSIPDHADYLPEVTDPNCKDNKTCFLPDESRSFLLSGKVFYFLTEKQYQRLKECINNGGGICKLAVSLESLASLDELVNNNAIVMSVDGTLLSSLDNNRKQWVEEALSFVKSKGYRTIVDSEVGFALLSVSIEKHCNPLSHQQVVDPLPPPSMSQQPVTSGNSLGNVTVYASETQLTEPGGSSRTAATPKSTTKEPHNCSIKIESDGEDNDDNEISVSLSVPTDPPRVTPSISNLTQSASKYYEPPEAPISSGTSQTPVRGSDDEGKIPPAVPSPDGLSCSPSTFRSSLPTSTNASVLVPGTFAEKINKEQDAKAVSKLFTTRKRKLPADEDEAADSTDHDVVDLTQEEDIRPKTTATSTTNSVNIFSVLSKKRQKRGAELAKAEMEKAKAEKARLEMEKAKAEKAKTTTKPMPTSSSSAVIDITDNRQHTDFCDPKGNNETPVRPSILTSASGRLHHSASMSQGMSQSASQEVMDSDSQRPTLTRFRRFAERYSNVHKSNGYLSARVRSTTVTAPDESATDLDLPVPPPVVCEAVSLVVHRVAVAGLVNDLSSEDCGPVNFKKFKKAKYIGIGSLPTIIGGADLIRFTEEMSTLTQEWQYEREHEMDNDIGAGDDDPDLFRLPGDRPR
ncbi:nibrin-like isoform X2 [Dysidea avara]|uniref:nibrin-like isoform X2 n=1 Tax=Dysidea avara TaxID=196820 RepID=UPI00332FE090